jgi:sugar phosphate isomerase/epimerase
MNYGCSFDIVDLHFQEPNRNQRECKYFWDEFYSLVSAAGFDTIAIPYEPKWDFGGRSGVPRSSRSIVTKFQTVENYLAVLKQAGIRKVAGVHMNPSLFISENLDMYFSAFVHFASEAVEFTKEIGADYLTLTATPSYGALRAVCPKETSWEDFSSSFLERTKTVLEQLGDLASKSHVQLCLKNEYWTLLRGRSILPFIKSCRADIRLDLDTAQLQIAGVDPVSVIKDAFDMIGCVHFTDTAFVDDSEYYQQPLPEFPAGRATQVFRDIGQGNVDFPSIVSALEEKHYAGSIIWNSHQTRNVFRSLLRARAYINAKLAETY